MSAPTEPKHVHGPHCSHGHHHHAPVKKTSKHKTWMMAAGVLFTLGFLIWTFFYSEFLTQ